MTEPPRADPRAGLFAGAAVYAVIVAVALGWLWMRDRHSLLPELAIGERGPWWGSASGLLVGLAGAWLMRWLGPRSAVLQAIERHARDLFDGVGETWTTVFVLWAAVAEEIFFRLAVQDAIGLPWAVAVYAIMNSSIAGLGVLPLAALHAAVLGLLVQHGFGLLGSTTAHAIMNHLSLRRILCTANQSR